MCIFLIHYVMSPGVSSISPMLIAFLGMDPYAAVGIALASDVLASAISAYTYGRNKNLDIKNGLAMMLTVMAFTFVGSWVASLLPDTTMGNFSMFTTLLMGIKFILQPVNTTKEAMAQADPKKRLIKSMIWGAIIGYICGFVGAGGGMMMLAAISVKDEPIVSLTKTWAKSIDWNLILLLSVTFPIAEVMRSADAGIMATVVGFMKPIVTAMGINGFMIVSMLLLGILTQVTHNIVLAAMFTPFLCPLIQQMGGNPYVMWFLMYFSLNASYVTPAASFQSAMVHGHERVSGKWCYIIGSAYSVITWIILILVTIPLANALC